MDMEQIINKVEKEVDSTKRRRGETLVETRKRNARIAIDTFLKEYPVYVFPDETTNLDEASESLIALDVKFNTDYPEEV